MTITSKQSVNSFKTLWLRYDEKSSSPHQLFIKEHSIRNQEPEYPRGKTLFVLNIPPYTTTQSLQKAFANACGNILSVTFSNKSGDSKNRFKIGYVVFENENGLDKALSLPKNHILTLTGRKKSSCLTGIIKWSKEYNNSICNEALAKQEIEEYMRNYDKRVEQRLVEEKETEEEGPDGWITVTGRKKRGQHALSRKESTIKKLQLKEEQRSKKKQLLNFYSFQIRESKKQNLAELRKKFELDKTRLQQLKSKRTFKPF